MLWVCASSESPVDWAQCVCKVTHDQRHFIVIDIWGSNYRQECERVQAALEELTVGLLRGANQLGDMEVLVRISLWCASISLIVTYDTRSMTSSNKKVYLYSYIYDYTI